MNKVTSAQVEIKSGDRFAFGENWSSYLQNIDQNKIDNSKKSLKAMLGDISGKSFLDMGSGSGIHSLAARELGANVLSIDFDDKSVGCAIFLKDKFYPSDLNWQIKQGSVLDDQFINSLGQFDIVYSWGVLHHTGNMNKALENADKLLKSGGILFISIYNDQGFWSKYWTFVKKTYNKNILAKYFWICFYIPFFTLKGLAKDIATFKNPFRRYEEYKKLRGMSIFFDIIDWIGGYPFECAKPETIFYFYKNLGYNLVRLKTCAGGLGCNEFVLEKCK